MEYLITEEQLEEIIKLLNEAENASVYYDKDKLKMAENAIDNMRIKIKLAKNAIRRIKGDNCCGG